MIETTLVKGLIALEERAKERGIPFASVVNPPSLLATDDADTEIGLAEAYGRAEHALWTLIMATVKGEFLDDVELDEDDLELMEFPPDFDETDEAEMADARAVAEGYARVLRALTHRVLDTSFVALRNDPTRR